MGKFSDSKEPFRANTGQKDNEQMGGGDGNSCTSPDRQSGTNLETKGSFSYVNISQ